MRLWTKSYGVSDNSNELSSIQQYFKVKQYVMCLEFWNLIVSILTCFQESGLSEWVGTQLKQLDAIPPVAIVICICVMITTFTEFTSNVATATIFLPILAFLVSTTWREEVQFYILKGQFSNSRPPAKILLKVVSPKGGDHFPGCLFKDQVGHICLSKAN